MVAHGCNLSPREAGLEISWGLLAGYTSLSDELQPLRDKSKKKKKGQQCLRKPRLTSSLRIHAHIHAHTWTGMYLHKHEDSCACPSFLLLGQNRLTRSDAWRRRFVWFPCPSRLLLKEGRAETQAETREQHCFPALPSKVPSSGAWVLIVLIIKT